MIKSKAWNWSEASKDIEKIWLEPSIESYYLLERWKDKKDFLDLGCGLGRHTILFAKNGFNVSAFDLSEEAILKTKKYAKQENVNIKCMVGDMINLPYQDNSFDAILCRNVIGHTDTEGIKKIILELKRVLKDNGEVYLTLCSKETWGYKQDTPVVDENTKIKVEDGPENGIPHFYADYDLIKELFKDFKIEFIYQVEDFYESNGKTFTSYHYHVLIRN